MHMEWNDDLSIGVEEIDDQHRELFARVNGFFEGLKEGGSSEEISKLFVFLQSYVHNHFALEEDYMTRFVESGNVYHGYASHKAEHTAFIRDFLEFKKDIETTGADPQLVAEFNRWIGNWLAIHVSKIDKELGSYLREVFPFLSRK